MEDLKIKYELLKEGDFADVYSCGDLLICICKSPYIPIEAFKDVFHVVSTFLEDEKFKGFLFDKRSLRSFHQPSMEWYFVNWKLDMYEKFGLQKHFKILPKEKWFKKCVEAGRHEIFEKHGHEKFEPLQIQYVDTIEEGIAQFTV